MKSYTATIRRLTVAPSNDAPTVMHVVAKHVHEAARTVADAIAAERYGKNGIAPFVTEKRAMTTADEPFGASAFMASIGEYKREGGWGVTRGENLRIVIQESLQ